MFARKTLYAVTAGALLAASVPALADHGRWDRGPLEFEAVVDGSAELRDKRNIAGNVHLRGDDARSFVPSDHGQAHSCEVPRDHVVVGMAQTARRKTYDSMSRSAETAEPA